MKTTTLNLLDVAKNQMQKRQLSSRTETAYLDWIYRYLLFNNKHSPHQIGEEEVGIFLNYLSNEGKKSASTQNQAHCALIFFYNEVLHQPLAKVNFTRLKRYPSAPHIFSKKEIEILLKFMDGVPKLVASLLYGCGLKIMEALSLRIRDIDFENKQMILKDRVLFLPQSLEQALRTQIKQVGFQHEADLQQGLGNVDIPATVLTQNTQAEKELQWQYVFPAIRTSISVTTKKEIRYHLHESVLQKAIKQALLQAKLNNGACCHSLRHSFAAHLLEGGYDMATVQQLLGLRNKRSTIIYTYFAKQKVRTIKSPLDDSILQI